MPNPPDNFFLINLNNVIHLPQMELLLGKCLSGELDASLNFMQFQTQSEIRSVVCDLSAGPNSFMFIPHLAELSQLLSKSVGVKRT